MRFSSIFTWSKVKCNRSAIIVCLSPGSGAILVKYPESIAHLEWFLNANRRIALRWTGIVMIALCEYYENMEAGVRSSGSCVACI